MAKDVHGLTPKQRRFVEEYPIDLNATQAAIRAGYSAKTAYSIGHENLSKPEIALALRDHVAALSKHSGVTAQSVLTRLDEVADRCMQAEPVLDREGKEVGEYTFHPAGANKALELLGKHLALFTDNLRLAGRDGGPIEFAVPLGNLSAETLASIRVELEAKAS